MTHTPRRKKTRRVSKIKASGVAGAPDKMVVEPQKQNLLSSPTAKNLDYVPFGDNNLFPQAVAHLIRHSGVHRGILQSKHRYVCGKGFEQNDSLDEVVRNANPNESLHQVLKKVFRDKIDSGIGYIQVVRYQGGISLFHTDYTKCRVGHLEYEGQILIHPDWSKYQSNKDLTEYVPIYPEFSKPENGYEYSMIQLKDYEPEFYYYGVPTWIAGLNAATIAYKTNKWNVSRLDNGYRLSGILFLDGEFSSEEAEQKFDEDLDKVHTDEDNRGRVLKVKKNSQDGDNSRFETFPTNEDADWTNLHSMSKEELLIANQWYPALAGFNTSDGFSRDRILNEYEVANAQTIEPMQAEMLEVIRRVYDDQLNLDMSDLKFINKSPILDVPDTMMVWEERKSRGVDYDENDPKQQIYMAELKGLRKIDISKNE